MKSRFAMMADYNAWANGRLYKMASRLSAEQYRRDVGAYFKSLHSTLNHIMCADLIWMFNHQTHHRGQAHAILTVLGVSEPDGLDLLLMQWERG